MIEQEKIINLNIDLLVPNKYQPRKVFNDASLKELSLSIKEYGVLNPILVRKIEDKYEIIAGERRVRAAKMAGLTQVPVIIKNISDKKSAELALIENIQRENISPIEEALAYEQILTSPEITEQKLSEMVGKSQSFISNKLRLLKLPESIQNALKEKKISERHARSLINVKDETKQIELLNRVMNEKLTVKELDNIINEKKITEEEIQSAINDIMKSLNINDEEKEEKESDKMNNGSFFPNMNQNMQTNQVSEPATLNSMNMQTMGVSPTNNFEQAQPQMMPQPGEQMPSSPVGFNNPQPLPQQVMPQPDVNPIPDFNLQAAQSPMMEQTPEPAPVSQDMPLFGNPMPEPQNVSPVEQNVEPIPTPVTANLNIPVSPQPEMTASSPVMQDTPLFNNEVTMPSGSEQVPLNEPVYDVPVNVSPVIEFPNNNEDKLTKIQELLSNNGIEYKSYSNDTGHCIIIEL